MIFYILGKKGKILCSIGVNRNGISVCNCDIVNTLKNGNEIIKEIQIRGN